MSEPWEKGKKSAELPNPHLNPLQNATLGRNLGRWAQVYFTSPPERRAEAVGDLLRELEAETDQSTPQISNTDSQVTVPSLICRVCQQSNDLNQSFCGLCGSPLREGQASRQGEMPARPSSEQVAPPGAEGMAQSRGGSENEDLEWLREKSLSRLYEYDESSGKWKYALAALIMLAATFGGLQWLSNRPAAISPQPATSASQAQPAPAPAASAETPPAVIPSAPPASDSTPPQATIHPASKVFGTPSSASLPPAAPMAAEKNGSGSVSDVEGGGRELYFAQGYLEGKHGRRDSVEAAKWLWKAVAKQNTTADVLLADLYMTGDGVTKSCDQARLLLNAASQKGATEAAEKLRILETHGCR